MSNTTVWHPAYPIDSSLVSMTIIQYTGAIYQLIPIYLWADAPSCPVRNLTDETSRIFNYKKMHMWLLLIW